MLELQFVQRLLQLLHLLLCLNFLVLQLTDLQLRLHFRGLYRVAFKHQFHLSLSLKSEFYLEGLRDVFTLQLHALTHQLQIALIVVHLRFG